MKKLFLSKIPALLLALVVGLICASPAFASATIIIQNVDASGVGFNDPTPVSPVGGNPGTTLGQQRLHAFNFAASIWGATLTSNSVITVRARWMALECTANSAVLGSAGPTSAVQNFPNAPLSSTYYPAALANAIAGSDLDPSGVEIQAQFNLNLGTTGCLENRTWYYGLDNNHGPNDINLVTVLLHEFGHGLGFLSLTDEETGTQFNGIPSVYDRFLLDNSTGKPWPQMTDAERKASAINRDHLVWYGQQVVADAGFLTAGKDSSGRPWMWAPNPLDSGSSVSHWAREAFPHQLMEPNINHTLSHSVTTPQDLTYSLLRDIGWCQTCPPSVPLPLPPAPANDSFANAQIVTGCAGSVSGTNVGATRQGSEPRHAPDNNVGAGSVWYQWQAPASGTVTLTTTNSDYDTMLGVYTGSSVSTLSVVLQPDGTPAKNDDVQAGVITTSSVTFNATANTVYKIAIDGWGGARGNIVLNWTQSGCVQTSAPVVLTEEGTNRAVALDSVTQMREPFPIIGAHNFSVDQRTRVMLFTTNLGLNPGDNLSVLQVRVQGVALTVERAGPLTGVTNGSYIIVKLDNSTPVGNNLPLVVTLNGVASTNDARIDITAN